MLCTLLVFGSSGNAIPVAWIINSASLGQDIQKWMTSLIQRIKTKDSGWKPNAVLMDDPAYEASVFRYVSELIWFLKFQAFITLLLKQTSLSQGGFPVSCSFMPLACSSRFD